MNILLESWKILCELAPWLLLGMLLSGCLHVLLPENFIRRKLTGMGGVLKAVGLGVPLPLCSCGVIPAGIGLKNQGASNGAAVGFLISTPQTGVDSMLVSASFFGWPFAVFKMITAAITGIIGGWLTDRLDREVEAPAETTEADTFRQEPQPPKLWAIWVHGLEIVRSIWIWLVIGIVISALIQVAVPTEWFAIVGGWGLLPAMLLVLVASIPLYVCATASVPIAAAIVHGGLPPAAALVFLMAGPATNITTIGAIHSRFGWKTLAIYLSTIIVGSMAFAWLFDWLLTANVTAVSTHQHDHQNGWSIASAVVLLVMIGYFIYESISRRINHRLAARALSTTTGKIQTVAVTGMTCGNCVAKLESALGKLNGIQSAVVELHPGEATVIGDVDLKTIQQTIQECGFHVVEVARLP